MQLNLDIHGELIIDNFAGGGGASTAIVAVAVFPGVLMIIGLIFLSGLITGERHD